MHATSTTHSRVHTSVHTHTYVRMQRMHIRTQPHAHTCRNTRLRMDAHSLACSRTCIHAVVFVHAHELTNAYSLTCSNLRIHLHSRTFTHEHAYTRGHTHAFARNQTHRGTCVNTHSYICACIPTHIHGMFLNIKGMKCLYYCM